MAGPEGALKRQLSEVLGVHPRRQAIREIRIDLPDVLLIALGEVQPGYIPVGDQGATMLVRVASVRNRLRGSGAQSGAPAACHEQGHPSERHHDQQDRQEDAGSVVALVVLRTTTKRVDDGAEPRATVVATCGGRL